MPDSAEVITFPNAAERLPNLEQRVFGGERLAPVDFLFVAECTQSPEVAGMFLYEGKYRLIRHVAYCLGQTSGKDTFSMEDNIKISELVKRLEALRDSVPVQGGSWRRVREVSRRLRNLARKRIF